MASPSCWSPSSPRCGGGEPHGSQGAGRAFEVGDLRVDLAHRRVPVGGRAVALASIEYRLLCALVRQAGQALAPAYLLDRVWGRGHEGETHLVRKVVYRLRQKIEPDPRNPRYVLTKPGSGYLFEGPDR